MSADPQKLPPIKLLRCIRLDPSDTFAFEKAAEPGEWVVPGSFIYLDQDVSSLKGLTILPQIAVAEVKPSAIYTITRTNNVELPVCAQLN